MKPQELANELRDMYSEGLQKREVNEHIILFGIKYVAELDNAAKQADWPIRKMIAEIITLSGLRESRKFKKNTYIPEISRGMKLAQYVKPKK